MGKIILTISLVLAIITSFGACSKEPSAQEIVDGVIDSLDEIRTYQFDIDMTVGIAGEAEGEKVEATMVIDLDGAWDLENSQMKIDMAMSMEGLPEFGEDRIEIGIETYLVSDSIYMMMDVPEMDPTWMKSEMPEGYRGRMSQVESQIKLLEAAQVKVAGSETIEGTDCYVLQLTLDTGEQLWQLAMQQLTLTGDEVPDVTDEFLQEMFPSFSVKQWIAKDTYFPIKAEIDMVVDPYSAAMNLQAEGSMPTDIYMVLLLYNYNQPVSIELPPEAEEAELQEIRAKANSEAAVVRTAAAAYYAENERWPTNSTELSDYLDREPCALYHFDDQGRIDSVSNQTGYTAELSWDAKKQEWYR